MTKVSGKIFDTQLFRKLLEFVKPYKTTYYFVMTSAILLSFFSTLTPYLLKVTVDDYIRLQDYKGMVLMVSLMIGTLIFEVLFQFLFVFSSWIITRSKYRSYIFHINKYLSVCAFQTATTHNC